MGKISLHEGDTAHHNLAQRESRAQTDVARKRFHTQVEKMWSQASNMNHGWNAGKTGQKERDSGKECTAALVTQKSRPLIGKDTPDVHLVRMGRGSGASSVKAESLRNFIAPPSE